MTTENETAEVWMVGDTLSGPGGRDRDARRPHRRAAGIRPGGKQVVTGSADGLTYIWDVSVERLLSRFRRQTDLINPSTSGRMASASCEGR